MFKWNILLVATLFAILVNAYCTTEGPFQLTEVNANVLYTKSENAAVLTQLKSNVSDSSVNSIFTYKCTVGTKSSNHLACIGHDKAGWPTAHDVQLNLRCPKSGSGLTLSYAEIVFTVSSNSVKCFVNEGAIGMGYLGVTIQAWNTLVFEYSAQFFST